jgi:hypothetical protein
MSQTVRHLCGLMRAVVFAGWGATWRLVVLLVAATGLVIAVGLTFGR